ncbi:hypothetical protein EBQ34_08875 [Vandammella animalimorsus]|uniref:DUF600 domain-containing protein n=1 Tax=Vandammella animalimorsus TaxID=2029117 RepID=A0A3M6RI47_9BURK|nr:hypothetical protein [Vandammella animalimorsus]RMX14821.1 hypothetical protein EBQ34_08875 [Vandammella animalimorsus]
MNQNEALIDLCKACVQDAKLTAQQGWQKLILIAEVTSASVKAFGYSYNQQGACQLVSPSLDFDMDKLRALQQIMQTENPNGRGWLKCLIRISRAGDVGADFEYDDPNRWNHTPDNYKQRMAEYAAMPV